MYIVSYGKTKDMNHVKAFYNGVEALAFLRGLNGYYKTLKYIKISEVK